MGAFASLAYSTIAWVLPLVYGSAANVSYGPKPDRTTAQVVFGVFNALANIGEGGRLLTLHALALLALPARHVGFQKALQRGFTRHLTPGAASSTCVNGRLLLLPLRPLLMGPHLLRPGQMPKACKRNPKWTILVPASTCFDPPFAPTRTAFAYGGHNMALEIQSTIPLKPPRRGNGPASSVRQMEVGVYTAYAITSETPRCSGLRLKDAQWACTRVSSSGYCHGISPNTTPLGATLAFHDSDQPQTLLPIAHQCPMQSTAISWWPYLATTHLETLWREM